MGTQNIMPPKQIRTVTIEFADGTTETHLIPDDQGFIQEKFTYEPKPGDVTGISKWGPRLRCFTIFWSVVA